MGIGRRVPEELAVEVSPMLMLEDVKETDPASHAIVKSIVFE